MRKHYKLLPIQHSMALNKISEEISAAIRRYALENAVKFNGKANPNALIGRIMGDFPEARQNGKEILAAINTIVAEVNLLSLEQQQVDFQQLAPELLNKKPQEKRKGLPELKNVNITHHEVVLRFEPSPSGPLHVGHAYVLGLNTLYARKYDGQLILRIADTNSGNIYTPAYDLIPEDGLWLTDKNITQFIIQSDRLDLYYNYALKLIDLGGAYMCTCTAEEFKECITQKTECPCRQKNVNENVKDWHKMFTQYKQGDAVMRLKTDVTHKNPALRDFPLFRINEDEHPRQAKKYKVWPLMNFAVSVDDHDTGVTHILRAKDHADNAVRQKMIFKYFNWSVPETIFVGKINFKDLNVSCSKTKPLILDGTYEGWDDIRLPFIPALRRRGYQPEAFMRYAEEVGVTLSDKSVSKEEFFKTIDHFNKEVLEKKSNRYFFVPAPVKIKVEKAPEQQITLDLHPDLRKGGRSFFTKDTFYLPSTDILEDGKEYRLMDCLTFKFSNGRCMFTSKKLEGKPKIIQWISDDKHNVNVEIRMSDNSLIQGLGEPSLENLSEGDEVMFVRFGFCRLDKIEGDVYKFWFTHK